MVASVSSSLAGSAATSASRISAGAGRAVATGGGMGVIGATQTQRFEAGYDGLVYNEYSQPKRQGGEDNGNRGSGRDDGRSGGREAQQQAARSRGRDTLPVTDLSPGFQLPDVDSLRATAEKFRDVTADTDNADLNSYRSVDRTIHGRAEGRGLVLDLVI